MTGPLLFVDVDLPIVLGSKYPVEIRDDTHMTSAIVGDAEVVESSNQALRLIVKLAEGLSVNPQEGSD